MIDFRNLLVKSIFIWVLTILSSCNSNEVHIYLSPTGNDLDNGNASNPVATLTRAAELARSQVGEKPIIIHLSGGIYNLSETLKLTTEDSGTDLAPIRWQAIEGEKPIISGGITVKNWKENKNGLWSATLPEAVKAKFRSFYVRDNRAIRARFPNNDFLTLDEVGQDNRTNFFFKENEFPKVENIKDLELALLHDWSMTRINIKSIDWDSKQLVTVDSIGSQLDFFTLNNWEDHPRYYLENAKEYCDSPGEWYCDFESKKIYYYPLPEDRIENMEGIIPIVTKLLTLDGNLEQPIENLSFKGISFEHSAWQLPLKGYCGVQATMFTDRTNKSGMFAKVPAAIELTIAKNIEFKECIVKHTGGSGIWIGRNSNNCEINSSHIYDISGNGINLGEGNSRKVNNELWWESVPEQVANNNKISHSLIEDCGVQFYGSVAIWAGLVANTKISNNEIRNLPYTGISTGWIWNSTPTPCEKNIIDSNHIHHIMKKLSDGGGIYCLGAQPKSEITNNLIHDVTINVGRAESNGMFLDEGIKDVLVANNIVYNIAKSPLRFHKAAHNIVENNVFMCNEKSPPIAYNRTKEDSIIKIDNLILRENSKKDIAKLNKLVEKRKGEFELK